MVKVSPDTAVVILDVPVILIVSLELRVTPVLSSPTMVIVELVRYELRLGPVIVKVSPDTAVVMLLAPAILIVSPVFNVVPEESSPTTVIGELVRYELKFGPVIVTVSFTTAVVMPVAPANFRVSVVLIVLPEESSPTKVMPVNALKLVKLNIPDPLVTNTWLAEPSVEG